MTDRPPADSHSKTPSPALIEQRIVALLDARAASASICPSEVARALVEDEAGWRALMPTVRQVAADMQDAGTLRITRGEDDVDRSMLDHGPIRLRRR